MTTYLPAFWTAANRRSEEPCGRPTRKGTPCKNAKNFAGGGGFFLTASYQAEACTRHLTDEEWGAYETFRQAYKAAEEDLLHRYHQSLPVACWDWPVTDEHRVRAAKAHACTNPDEAHTIAWNLLADWQDDRCAVCGGRSDVLDHDHKTALVRGWLCRSCNGLEPGDYIPGGQFDRYRQRNPASILGIEIRYYDPIFGWAEPDDRTEEDRFQGAIAISEVMGRILGGK